MDFRDKMQWDMVSAIGDSLRESGSATVVAATGAGKTETVRKLKTKLKDHHSLLFIAPRINNVTDAAKRYDASINIGSLGLNELGQVTCTTKQSIHKIDTSDFDFVVYDEAHNYSEEFIESINAKYKIFLTATPWNDNGFIWEQYNNVPEPCFTFSLEDGIKNNILTRFEIFGTKHAYDVSKYQNRKGDYTKKQISEIISQEKHQKQVEEIIQICEAKGREKIAILCGGIDHAEKIKEEMELQGQECMIAHSKLKNSHKVIEQFEKSSAKFICSVAMMQEGTDIPPIDCIVYLRPIKSSRVMVQSVGRGLRIFKGKEYCLLIDFGYVFESCGLPTKPLIPTSAKANKKEMSPIKQCENCFYIYDRTIHGRECPDCGHQHINEVNPEKNLRDSVLEYNEIKTITASRVNIYKTGKTKGRGVKYITLQHSNTFYTLFGNQVTLFFNALKEEELVKINFKVQGKNKFKFISIRPFGDF